MKKISYIALALLFWTCTTENEAIAPETNNDALLKLFVEDGTTSDSNRMFYIVKGENGEHLASGELFNLDEIELVTGSYSGDNIAVSILRYRQLSSEVSIITYLDVPKNKSIILDDPFTPFPQSRTQLQLGNFPSNFEEIVIAQSGRYSPVDFIFEENFSYSFFESTPEIVITSLLKNETPTYQTLVLDTNTQYNINLSEGKAMETSHSINVALSSPEGFEYTTTISGIATLNDTIKENNYRLYQDRNAIISNNQILVYTPSIFENFNLSLKATNQNNSYIQATYGAIPSSFGFINPEISIINSDLSNFDISTQSNQVSYILSKWHIENTIGFSWNIVSPSTVKGRYNLQELPESIVNEISLLQDLNTVQLSSVIATNTDDLNYDLSLERLFKSDQTKTLLKLAKEIHL